MADRPGIRLVVNADDFGSSRGANAAVLRSHREGILTSASLMVSGDAAEEAVAIAMANPTLGVGLHLALSCARPVLGATQVPGLVGKDGRLDPSPARAGLRFFLMRGLRRQIASEIEAQLGRFARLGLRPGHLDGHCNIHLHPTVLGMVLEQGRGWGLRSMRLTRDPWVLNLRLARGRHGHRASHALVFHLLSVLARPRLRRAGVRHVDRVFGLLQNDRVNEGYLLGLMSRLGPGAYELYCHPDEAGHRDETEALCSDRVRARVAELGIRLARHEDLFGEPTRMMFS